MILRGIVIVLIAGISLYSSGVISPFDSKKKEEAIVYAVRNTLEYIHFAPKELNDEFSEKMFYDYIDMIDGSKRFLTRQDIDKMTEYKFDLDDQLLNSKLAFFDLSLELLNNGLKKTSAYYKEILAEPFDFDLKDRIEIDIEKRSFVEDDIALKAFWKKFVKYEVLTRLAAKIEENKKEGTPKSLEELEKETRKKLRKVYDDWFKRMDKLRRSDRFEVYVDAMTHNFDPHSDYFSPKDKQDFDIRMGHKLEGIGARLQADGDYTKVVSIIAGGPAWRGKELEVNDLILQVAQNEKEFVDITGMRLDDVVQLIRGKKDTRVTLQVKKKDGSIKEILIVRDEVIIEEGRAKSVIMSHDDIIDDIGFIKLPSFYSDFSDVNGSSCADDVAEEIKKLKEQDVKGIILDLRYNGGGSLKEVVDMAGFFVEEGPIVQVKPRKDPPYVYQDQDKGDVKYDGPLVILVNSFSVSASEIMAAAMQDYKRAVIVGSRSTFGKGTVQRFFDLDRAIKGAKDLKPLGELKLTTQKFYRINGGSTQLKGVMSDVVLPDTYYFIETGEKELDNAMQWTKIEGREYTQNVYRLDHLPEIVRRSTNRVKNDKIFKLINENAALLKKLRDNTMVPLNLKEYEVMLAHRQKGEDKFEELMDIEAEGLEVINLPQDTDFIQMDSSRIGRNAEWLKALHKDVYAEESMRIIRDMIEVEGAN